MRRSFLKLAGATALAMVPAGMAALPARADEAALMIVNLTSDDVWTSQMALQLARNLRGDGADVAVFLNVRAVTLGNRRVTPHRQGGTGKTAHEVLAELMQAGVRVFVCPVCTSQAGLAIDDRLPGIEIGGPDFRRLLMAPGTRIMSY